MTAGGSVGADQVLELLSGLVGRSLVIADTEGVETRFRLLETIRQYAQEHLDEGGDGDQLHAEHASYYALFGDLAIRNLDGTEGIDSELRLERELDNIGAALRWSIETDDAETAVRLFAMWHAAPRLITDVAFAATLRWAANTVVAMPKASGHPQYPAALAVAGAIAVNQGDPELAARRCDEAVAAEQRLGTETTVMLWLIRSNADLGLGHPHEAVEHAHQAVALSRARGEPAWLAQSLSMSALAQALQGDAASALPAAEEVVSLAHRLANPHLLENALAFAAFALADSDPERSLAIAREAVGLIRPGDRSLAWGMAGDVAARRGDPDEALRYMARAIEDAHWLGNRLAVGNVIGRAGALLARADPEVAAVLLGAGEAIVPGYSHSPGFIEAREQGLATADAELGVARREELYQHGMTMTDDEAVNYALAAIKRSLVTELRS